MNLYSQPDPPTEFATTREIEALRAHVDRLEREVRALTLQHQVRHAAAKAASSLSIPVRLAIRGFGILLGAAVVGEVFWYAFVAR